MTDADAQEGSRGPSSSPARAPAPPNRTLAWKIVATVAVISGAVGVLLFSSAKSEAQYYKHVDEVMADPAALHGKRLQVHGNVVTIEQKKGSLDYRFQIESRPPRAHALITATYTGIVPDTFKPGSEVVASGLLAADDSLKVASDGIMAKCPSKYDAAKQAASGPLTDKRY